mmetsp:Transcript_114368/g.198260  ORF Transcript_114368/g.198260 Transcript_114368/m.198260 type:complete len:215 (+) Transcript_114368:1195-1839(+)
MASEGPLFLASAKIPDLRMGIVCTRAEFHACGRNADVADRVLVALKCLEVVQVLVKELDHPQLVPTDQDRLLWCPLHRLHGRVVCLEDILEVELEAIPDRDLTSLGTTDEPPAVGKPMYHIDGCPVLVGRCVHEATADRVIGTLRCCKGRHELLRETVVALQPMSRKLPCQAFIEPANYSGAIINGSASDPQRGIIVDPRGPTFSPILVIENQR